MSPRPPWWGTTTADVLVLDVPTIGPDEARTRVLSAWEPGSTLHLLPDGRWALRLGGARRWRAESAPGLPLTQDTGGRLRWTWHGVAHEALLDELPRVHVADWVDLAGLPVEQLIPLERPASPEAQVVVPPPPRHVNLSRLARVSRDARAATVAADLARRTAEEQGRARGRAQGGGQRSGGRAPRRNRFAELVLRAPTGGLVTRRHARYLRELTDDFERRNFDAALRKAIALTGAGGRLSLRMPAPRQGRLRPRTGPDGPGRALGVGGPTVDSHLRALYQRAAERLEADGRVEEAAFVHADLLGAVGDAVRLLERHQQLVLGATLAQQRGLSPEIAVRLWWLAGERARAIELARSRGAFAAVLERLPGEDRAAWRREWVYFCRATDDPVGAVRAAWPEPGLRDDVRPDLARALALGGTDAAEMFALAVTQMPGDGAVEAAEGLLGRPVTEDASSRLRFVETLGAWAVTDPAADRRLTTQALRLLVREPHLLSDLSGPGRKNLIKALTLRADALAAADLPRPSVPQRQQGAPLAATLAGAGQVPVFDAAVTSTGVLVALGDYGMRLCGPAGQVLARWDVPAHQIVLADHGAAALLAVRGDALTEFYRVDLATRRVSQWLTLRLHAAVSSFGGAGLLARDSMGIVLLDTTSNGAARELWRQRLRPGEVVVDLARSPMAFAAVIRADG
ncbi:MAG TPA: bpX6 domain-containing protein, partial [Propionicimonas sp.]